MPTLRSAHKDKPSHMAGLALKTCPIQAEDPEMSARLEALLQKGTTTGHTFWALALADERNRDTDEEERHESVDDLFQDAPRSAPSTTSTATASAASVQRTLGEVGLEAQVARAKALAAKVAEADVKAGAKAGKVAAPSVSASSVPASSVAASSVAASWGCAPPGDSSDESIEVVDDDDEGDDEKRSRVEERDGSQSTSAKAAAAAEVRLSFQREIQIEKCTADVHVARLCKTSTPEMSTEKMSTEETSTADSMMPATVDGAAATVAGATATVDGETSDGATATVDGAVAPVDASAQEMPPPPPKKPASHAQAQGPTPRSERDRREEKVARRARRACMTLPQVENLHGLGVVRITLSTGATVKAKIVSFDNILEYAVAIYPWLPGPGADTGHGVVAFPIGLMSVDCKNDLKRRAKSISSAATAMVQHSTRPLHRHNDFDRYLIDRYLITGGAKSERKDQSAAPSLRGNVCDEAMRATICERVLCSDKWEARCFFVLSLPLGDLRRQRNWPSETMRRVALLDHDGKFDGSNHRLRVVRDALFGASACLGYGNQWSKAIKSRAKLVGVLAGEQNHDLVEVAVVRCLRALMGETWVDIPPMGILAKPCV